MVVVEVEVAIFGLLDDVREEFSTDDFVVGEVDENEIWGRCEESNRYLSVRRARRRGKVVNVRSVTVYPASLLGTVTQYSLELNSYYYHLKLKLRAVEPPLPGWIIPSVKHLSQLTIKFQKISVSKLPILLR